MNHTGLLGLLIRSTIRPAAQADAAGIVLGARVPIILTSRADSVTTRLAARAVAALIAQRRRENPSKAVV